MIPKYLKIYWKQVSTGEQLSVTVPQEESRHVPNLMEWVHPQARHRLQCWIQDHVNAFACGKSCVPWLGCRWIKSAKIHTTLMLYHATLCFIVLHVWNVIHCIMCCLSFWYYLYMFILFCLWKVCKEEISMLIDFQDHNLYTTCIHA